MSHRATQRGRTGVIRDATKRAEASSPPGPRSSSPSTPAKPTVRSRDAVIAASDDEDGDDSASDDSLEDLATILGTRPLESSSQPVKSTANTATQTPRAKRTALELPSSPLTLNPKVHKFDLNALAKAARLDDAINASSARARAANEDMERQSKTASRRAATYGSSDEDDDDDRALVGVVTDNAGDDAHKVLRAVKRAEQGGTHARYFFFDTNHAPSTSRKPPTKIRGQWRLLTLGNVSEREQNVASGLPQIMMSKVGQLPDELFEWMLDEVCVQESTLLRLEYSNLVAQCPTKIEMLITPGRLDQMLFRLGASSELTVKESALTMMKLAEDPYEEREWSCLASFLSLMTSIAASLSLATAIYAAQVLLRLSMDPVILQAPGLLLEYQGAITVLLNAIPLASWDTFCLESCILLDTIVQAVGLRISIVICLPVQDQRAHELRRRLAIAFFLNDTSLAGVHPAEAITIRDLINRLHSSDFSIGPKTDFFALQSNILLLDAAIDDGCFSSMSSNTEGLDDTRITLHAGGDATFDAEIDELADRLRGIWRKINDTGLKLARTEAKGVIEWVQQRLTHSVRTRKKLKKSVYDLESSKSLFANRRSKDDPIVPRRPDYIKQLLMKSGSARIAKDQE